MRFRLMIFCFLPILFLGCGGGSSLSDLTTEQNLQNNDNVISEQNLSTDISSCSVTLTPSDDIQKSIDDAVSKDVICLQDGLYNKQIILIEDKENITLKGITPHGAVFSGKTLPSSIDYYGLIKVNHSSHISIENLTVEDALISEGVGILIKSSDDVKIHNNLIQRTNSSGVLVLMDIDRSTSPTTILRYNNNIQITNNKIVQANIESPNSGNEALSMSGTNGFEIAENEITHLNQLGQMSGYKEGIDVKDGSNNGTIHDNFVHDIEKTCIYIDAWSHHTYNIEIFRNNIKNCGINAKGGAGINVASERNGEVENILIHNNFITGILTQYYSGINISTGNGQSAYDKNPIYNIAIINNTIYNVYSGIFISDKFQDFKGFENIFIANNLVDTIDKSGYFLGAKNLEYTTRNGGNIGNAYTNSLYTIDDFTITNNALRVYQDRGWDEYSDFRETAKNTLKLTTSDTLITTLPSLTTKLHTNMSALKDNGTDNIYSVIEGFEDYGDFAIPQAEKEAFLTHFKTNFAKDFNGETRYNATIDIGAEEWS